MLLEFDFEYNGITSTYVENTPGSTIEFPTWKDHLHIRGEYSNSDRAKDNGTGSPPHTWRIPTVTKLRSFCERITSTYVENT